MIDINWFNDLQEDEKLNTLKTFEGTNIKYIQLENVKHKMNIVEVVSLDLIVVRFVNIEDSNKTRLEFLNEHEFVYYLSKSLNNNSKGDKYERTKIKAYS